MDAELERALPLVQGRLLDLGCGSRPYEELLLGRCTDYVGVDWPHLIPERGSRPDVLADVLRLPFREGTAGTVLATEILEHLPSPLAFLAEVRRILKQGGTLLLSVPFLEPIHEEPRDFYRFTPWALRDLLEASGFADVSIHPRGGWWSVVLGSFVNQSVYNWANPLGPNGSRRYRILGTIALPFCALAQFLAFHIDRLVPSERYTLGWFVTATARASEEPLREAS